MRLYNPEERVLQLPVTFELLRLTQGPLAQLVRARL